MNIEGLQKFSSFREYFDDVKSNLDEGHQEVMDSIEKDREDSRPPLPTMNVKLPNFDDL